MPPIDGNNPASWSASSTSSGSSVSLRSSDATYASSASTQTPNETSRSSSEHAPDRTRWPRASARDRSSASILVFPIPGSPWTARHASVPDSSASSASSTCWSSARRPIVGPHSLVTRVELAPGRFVLDSPGNDRVFAVHRRSVGEREHRKLLLSADPLELGALSGRADRARAAFPEDDALVQDSRLVKCLVSTPAAVRQEQRVATSKVARVQRGHGGGML